MACASPAAKDSRESGGACGLWETRTRLSPASNTGREDGDRAGAALRPRSLDRSSLILKPKGSSGFTHHPHGSFSPGAVSAAKDRYCKHVVCGDDHPASSRNALATGPNRVLESRLKPAAMFCSAA